MGLDSVADCRENRVQLDAFRAHLNALRKIRAFRNSVLFVAVEGNNPQPTAVDLARVAQEFPPYAIIGDNKNVGKPKHRKKKTTSSFPVLDSKDVKHARPFVITSESSKSRQVDIANELLENTNNTTKTPNLTISKDAVVTNASLDNDKVDIMRSEPYGIDRTKCMVQILCNQLAQYRLMSRNTTLETEGWTTTRRKWSGKGNGQNDDLLMAFLICVLYATIITNTRRPTMCDLIVAKRGVEF